MVTKEEYAKLSMEVYARNVPTGWGPVGGQIANSFPSGMYVQALLMTGTKTNYIITNSILSSPGSRIGITEPPIDLQGDDLNVLAVMAAITITPAPAAMMVVVAQSQLAGHRIDAIYDYFKQVSDLETLKSQPQVAQNTAILADLVNAQDKVKQSVQDILSVELGNSQWSEADGANLLDITINLQHTLAQESQVIRVDLPDAAFDKFASSPGGCITTAQSVAL